MTTREDFEKWFKSVYTSPDFVARYDEYFTLNVYGEFVDWVEDRFRVWQACAAHYEAELLKRDALIAEKDARLESIVEYWNGDNNEQALLDAIHHAEEMATEALSLTHDSVRLEEVSTVNSVAKGDASWLVVSDTVQEPVGVERGTKLYTIVEGEAG